MKSKKASHLNLILTVIMILTFSFLLSACGSGPEKALKKTAKALEEKNLEAFKSSVEIRSVLRGLAEKDRKEKQNTMNQLRKVFGSSEDLFSEMMPNYTDVKMIDAMATEMEKNVSSGKLILSSKEKGLPWEPDVLRKAKVKETGENSAVVPVDSSIGLRTWLAIRQIQKDQWKITGLFENEGEAKYWCSDQRIVDIKTENENRIAQAQKYNAEILEKWKIRKTDYDKAVKEEEEQKLFCENQRELLEKNRTDVLQNVTIKNATARLSQLKKNKYLIYDIGIYKAALSNMNKEPVVIKEITLEIIDLDGNKVGRDQTWEPKEKCEIPAGGSIEKEWTFILNWPSSRKTIIEGIIDGKYKPVMTANVVTMSDKRFGPKITRSDLPGKCRMPIAVPVDPGPDPTLIKPVLLEI
jgi:hypothetical protein